MSDPIAFPRSWDVLLIMGRPTPGVCFLTGFARKYNWEVKMGKGLKGTFAVLNEFPPVEGTATFHFWMPEHFEEWRHFEELLKHDPTKKPTMAFSVHHPALERVNARDFVCKSVGVIEHKGQGLYSVSIDLLEYNPPPKKPAVGRPSGSRTEDPCGPGLPSDPVLDAKQREIQRLLKMATEPEPVETSEHISRRPRRNC